MKQTLQLVSQNLLLKIGERGALILVLLASFFLIYSETATQAYSQEQTISFQRADTNWYIHDGVEFQAINSSDNTAYSFETEKVTPTPSPQPIASNSNTESDIWEKLAYCESKGNWNINTGNGYYGGLQFNLSAWTGVGGQGYPHEASKDEQIMRGKILQEKRGWGPWGTCSKKLGLL